MWNKSVIRLYSVFDRVWYAQLVRLYGTSHIFIEKMGCRYCEYLPSELDQDRRAGGSVGKIFIIKLE
ncbi:hypothetical protein ASE72_18990 [Sphingomonas sp. Leaf20]|nr:hypothetical protein ASE72_18990 [Sphingomonas sp. Leaf20]